MLQQSEYELTNVEVNLKGLLANSGYHVHVAPVQGDLEFPCEATTLYDHWNPRKVNAKKSPPPKIGSSDAYEMGDLSGKFGTLDHLTEYMDAYNDTNLPLFGYESILGRSIVIHKKEKNVRWACSTLERGYSPSEAREIRAIASFHHPKGYAFGYMRFTQLIHKDGSRSDTVIEVNLRHPGYNDRNMVSQHIIDTFVARGSITNYHLYLPDTQSSLENIRESDWRRCRRGTDSCEMRSRRLRVESILHTIGRSTECE